MRTHALFKGVHHSAPQKLPPKIDMRNSAILLLALSLPFNTLQQKVVLTNDDGWAVAQIRAEYDALRAAGFQVC